MEELIKQIKEVFRKYEKNYSQKGIERNLDEWSSNKQGLIDLLRKHPCWNENELAVVIDFEEKRDIDEDKTMSAFMDVEFLHPVFDNNSIPPIYKRNEYAMYYNALYEAVTPFQKSLSMEVSEQIKQYADIKCTEGEKTSRVINKICERYCVAGHNEYNKKFAKLADAVNPKALKRKVILSVNPLDYLEMSNKDNSWKSCHRIDGGEYQAGTLSYMNDSVSMILYSVTDGASDFYKMPKINREVFCYDNGILLQSRLYPDDTNERLIRDYAGIVKNIISMCNDVDDDWYNEDLISSFCLTSREGLHYRDYNNGYGCLYKLKGDVFSHSPILIGNQAYCIYCGEPIGRNSCLVCANCFSKPMGYCNVCGDGVPENGVASYENGEIVCNDCSEQRITIHAA